MAIDNQISHFGVILVLLWYYSGIILVLLWYCYGYIIVSLPFLAKIFLFFILFNIFNTTGATFAVGSKTR
jgi:hypothetical protein